MRKHVKGILGACFLIVCLALVLSLSSCAWEIFTKGEISKEKSEAEVLEDLPGPVMTILEMYPGTDSDPDSVVVRLQSMLDVDSTDYCFVEMEVGELIPADGNDPDTILVDLRP